MKKEEIVQTNEFKELVKEFMISEAYGACDIKLHYEQHGLTFKPRSTDEEISFRVERFIERVSKEIKNESPVTSSVCETCGHPYDDDVCCADCMDKQIN